MRIEHSAGGQFDHQHGQACPIEMGDGGYDCSRRSGLVHGSLVRTDLGLSVYDETGRRMGLTRAERWLQPLFARSDLRTAAIEHAAIYVGHMAIDNIELRSDGRVAVRGCEPFRQAVEVALRSFASAFGYRVG